MNSQTLKMPAEKSARPVPRDARDNNRTPHNRREKEHKKSRAINEERYSSSVRCLSGGEGREKCLSLCHHGPLS